MIYPAPPEDQGGAGFQTEIDLNSTISHLQMGSVRGEVKVIDKNGGQTRGVLQSHMEEYGIR